ncbi:amino acid adenylation domain-containing protein [Streptomyces sp. AK08-02]|uniref:amino acid adenylation domain-containing protein n=1 Tax=Streptomyces sp. AK08-02 TaxID=3028654 RepID=UPI0029B98D9A|nr:amino acid adenylation domain-containing protein [Streptomyces sp. AK08-02]MDX3746442.1 amino acid adenylation domain-containing protein [Streptomyces sp. AK08-02]
MPTSDSVSAAGRHPLLAAQEGIWTGQQLDADSPAYNTAEYVRIDGPVDTAVLDTALHHVVAGTEALNVTFVTDDTGRPWQVDTPAGDWCTHIADLTAEPDPQAAALAWMDQDMARPVDLTRGPVFGHALLRTGREQYLWYHRVHHIALDGFGLSLVARRVAQVYTALTAGEPVPDSGFGTLESVRAEELAYRESARHTKDRAYWTDRYADRPPVASPAGRSALPARTFHRHVTDLDAARAAILRTVARELSVTWSEVVLAVTAAHLQWATGAPEIVLSLPAMGRLGSVSLRVPCMVRNILPLRVPVTPDDTLRDLATRVFRELRAGLPHQRYRYEQLRRDLKLVGGQRRLSGPGVNIMPFAYDLRFAGHRSTVHNVSAGPVDDLAVNVYDRGDGTGLRVALDANPDLYTASEAAGLQEDLLALLDSAVTAPDRPLRELAGAPAATSIPILDGGPLPAPARPVLSLIADHAARRGTAVAVEHAGDSITYAQLFGAARDTARRLAAHGVGAGDVVAVALPRGIDAVTAILGVLLSGAAYCPLDPKAPADRTAHLLTDAAPALVVTTGDHADDFADHALLLLDRPDPGPDITVTPSAPQLTDLAYVLHTSGSTGRPKGVEIGHDALAHFVAAATHRYGIQQGDRVLQFAPLHFDASVEELFLTLCAGGTLVIRADDMTESVPHFLDECARLRASVLDLPTAYWHEVAYAVSTGAAVLPEGVRTVVIGGEAALPERVDRWRKAVGTSVVLLNTYGPTEATVVATVADLHDPALAPGDVPIGLPLPGTRAAIVDGELYLLGDALARGYRGDVPDSSRFAPLTALPGAPRAYRTGDLVGVGEDGQLRFLGRADDEFKISGHRVQPAEVESALLTHPGIREAAVVGQTLADGTRRLVAHLVAETAAPAPALSSAHVREHLRARLPAAMIPSGVELLDRLPRTSSGKIDRATLSESSAHEAPTTGSVLERTITGIWRKLLGADTVTVYDDVFDLGAQSLQAIQAANRLGVELGREVKVAWLFQHPTAAALAHFLGEGAGLPSAPAGLPPTLLADAVLAPGVRPGTSRTPDDTPCRILLTGATGFVGTHLLAQLLTSTAAEIVCTVRARDRAEATARVHRALDQHGITLDERTRHRVTALPADLARPDLGLTRDALADLAATCDAIFHNAATVSIMRDYATLRAVNTESTRHLLRLAAVRTTPLHYVSTLSVAPPASHSPEVPEAFLPPHDGLRYGYQQSKWASERLLEQAAERGLPVTVHRLGRVVGSSGTGYVNERDFLWSVLRAGIPAGIVPDLFEDEVWTPVDFVARCLVHLCLTGAHTTGPVFHHATLPRVRLGDVYDWVEEYGYPVRRLPLARWREELPRSADVATTTLAFFESTESDELSEGVAPADLRLGHVHAGNVRAGLEGSGITCPPVDRDLLFGYLDHCVTAGVLPTPAGRQPHPATSGK